MRSILFASLLLGVLGAAAAWVARGVYDRAYLDEGVFHLVNAGEVARTIGLSFPSGERRSARVEAGHAVHFRVSETGEGRVAVTSDGAMVGSVGYVTSQNPLTLIVVCAEGLVFTQHLRGLEASP